MKKTKLTAGSNLLWEGSRMMLPEHKEAIIKSRQDIFKRTQPVLDEQRLDEISTIIIDSYRNHASIKLTIFNEYEDEQFSGIVTYIDSQLKHLKLRDGQQYFKIDCTLIIDASYEK